MVAPGAYKHTSPWQWTGYMSMTIYRQCLYMHVVILYKRVGPPDPLLTFWLTVVEITSQPTIPTVDTRRVASSLYIVVVKLSFCLST